MTVVSAPRHLTLNLACVGEGMDMMWTQTGELITVAFMAEHNGIYVTFLTFLARFTVD